MASSSSSQPSEQSSPVALRLPQDRLELVQHLISLCDVPALSPDAALPGPPSASSSESSLTSPATTSMDLLRVKNEIVVGLCLGDGEMVRRFVSLSLSLVRS